MEDIPITPSDWFKPELGEKWREIRQVRKVVTGAIEVFRQNKTIGSSLEASPLVYINSTPLFDKIKSIDFAEICITSALEISSAEISNEMFTLDDVDSVGVIFQHSRGNKCQRCWKFVNNFKCTDEHPNVCHRCSQVLNLQAVHT